MDGTPATPMRCSRVPERWALNETGRPAVLVATVEDLLAIAEHSPWSEDALYKAGLRAVLASSGHRTARRARSR